MPSSTSAVPDCSTCRPERTDSGVRWRVWAPLAKKVELVLSPSSARIAMEREDDGYFSIESSAEPHQRYSYSIDGGPPRPDPCTLHQPDGVHHHSALYFPGDFAWKHLCVEIDRGDLIIYELHIGTFTNQGTFDAAIERLDDLVELGINAIEVLPVSQFPGTRNWGYDGVHPYATQNSYGGPEAFQRFIDAAHARGLAVLLDVVFNHLGPEGNYLNEFGPYFDRRRRTPWGSAFNYYGENSTPVRKWVLDCVWQWIHDFRLDGLRFDAVHAMYDSSDRHILADITETAEKAALARGGKITIIAESLLNNDIMVTPRDQGGNGFDAEWNEDFHHAVSAWMTDERDGKYIDYGDREAISNVFENTFHLAGRHSRFYRQTWGRPSTGVPGDRFVISLQNHDHIGNRARGERLADLVRKKELKLGACLTMLAPYIPMLYMGEEYGETNPFLFFCEFGDPHLIDSVRRGRKRDYGLQGEIPDPQGEKTYLDSKLSWSWESDARQELRELYRQLIALRKTEPDLRKYTEKTVSWYSDVLALGRGDLTCLFHLGKDSVEFPIPGEVVWRSEVRDGDLEPLETAVIRVS